MHCVRPARLTRVVLAQGMRALQRRRLMNAVQMLAPEGAPDAAAPARVDQPPAQRHDAADAFDVSDVAYAVTVVTATERGSATDANVWVELHGRNGDTGCAPPPQRWAGRCAGR